MSGRVNKIRGSLKTRNSACSSFGTYAIPGFATGAGSVYDLSGNSRVYGFEDNAASLARDRCVLESAFLDAEIEVLGLERMRKNGFVAKGEMSDPHSIRGLDGCDSSPWWQ